MKAVGPAELGMALITGDESPAEMIVIAYGMEEGLRSFYGQMSSDTNDSEVSRLFAQLAEIEDRHKKTLFEQYKYLEKDAPAMEAFEQQIVTTVMEGGVTKEEFLKLNREALATLEGILTVAMTLETQALDLYLRYSHKSEDQTTRNVLYKLGDEEKAHLASLGKLMEEVA